jgi:TetR/AcrR family transcriptional repressor of mexJK operon
MPTTNTAQTAPKAGDAPLDRTGVRRGRGRLRVQDARELEAQLIAAAHEAFTTQGYGATSMAALARTAQISKTTLYAKFPTKVALFRAIIDQQLDRAYGAVQDTAGDAANTLAGSLRHLAEETLHQALQPENLKLNRLIDWEAPRFPELAEVARARARLGIEHIARYLRDFAARDQIPCKDPEAAAAIFNFMVRGLYYDIQIGARSPDAEELHAMVGRIVTSFLASRSAW